MHDDQTSQGRPDSPRYPDSTAIDAVAERLRRGEALGAELVSALQDTSVLIARFSDEEDDSGGRNFQLRSGTTQAVGASSQSLRPPRLWMLTTEAPLRESVCGSPRYWKH